MTHQLKTSKMSTKVISTFVALYLVFNVEGVEDGGQEEEMQIVGGNPVNPVKPIQPGWVPGVLPWWVPKPKPGPNPPKPGPDPPKPDQPPQPEHHHHHYHGRSRYRRDPVVITQYDIRDKLRLNNAMGQIMQLRSLVILLVYGYLMMNVLKKNDLGEKVFITLVSVYLIFFF